MARPQRPWTRLRPQDWNKFREYKENGLVKDVFHKKSTMDKLTGERGRHQRSIAEVAVAARTAAARRAASRPQRAPQEQRVRRW
jgi:hypothetical protein